MLSNETPLSEIDFVAFDLETTGLFAIAGQIVEIGAVRFRLDGPELDTFEQLVDPQCLIPAEVTRVHGITDRMVRGQPVIGDVLPRFLEFLGDADTILMAHNAGFDLGFLGVAMARLGIEAPRHRVLDTLDLAQKCLRSTRSHKLEHLAIQLRVAETEDHRGLSDSQLLMGVFRRIVARSRMLRTAGDLFGLSPPLGFQQSVGAVAGLPQGLDGLTAAIEQRRTVTILYQSSTKGLGERRVVPRGLVQSGSRAYLCAYCLVDRIEKTYRIERIRELRVDKP